MTRTLLLIMFWWSVAWAAFGLVMFAVGVAQEDTTSMAVQAGGFVLQTLAALYWRHEFKAYVMREETI
jgi:hypothetical protein